jgi:hypothetical protein
MSNEQFYGVIATDPVGPSADWKTSVDSVDGRPAQRVDARVDEGFLHLRIRLADPAPTTLTIGLDTLPQRAGRPPPGSGAGQADAALVLDLGAGTGQAWIPAELDPLPLDYPVPADARPAAVDGWLQYQLVTNRAHTVPSTGQQSPIELFDAGRLRQGPLDPADPEADSRSLWEHTGNEVTLRVPWALAGFSDPSSRQVLTPHGTEPASTESPGVGVIVSASGVDQPTGTVTWEPWQEVHFVQRLKAGAEQLQAAYVHTAGPP